jgi:hypothetical protein
MRIVVIVVIQLLLSAILTATVMPLVLITTPAAQSDARFGMMLMGGLLLVSFSLIALAWPRRLR